MDVRSASNFECILKRHRCTDDEVLFADRYSMIAARHDYPVRVRVPDLQSVMKRDRLKHGAQIVKAIDTSTDNLQM
jgi:hypothetical protein